MSEILIIDGDATFVRSLLADLARHGLHAAHAETLAKVAEAMSVQAFVGGKTVVDVIDKVFAGTPLAGLLDKVKHRSAGANGEPAQLAP